MSLQRLRLAFVLPLGALTACSVAFPTSALASTCVAGGTISGSEITGAAVCTNNSIAIGVGNGAGATATNYGVAIGGGTSAGGYVGVAIGQQVHASGDNSTALGSGSNATNTYSTAVGYTAQATGVTAAALGSFAKASGLSSTAVGDNAQAIGDGSAAFGNAAVAAGKAAIAIGQNASATDQGSSNIAIGQGAQATSSTSATGGDQLAIGTSAQATGMDSLAIGGQTTASGTNSIVLGNNFSTATGQDSIVIGVGSNATAQGAQVFGSNAKASQNFAVAIGNNSQALDIGSVALGSGSVTAAAVGTSGVTIGEVNYVFAGSNPLSTVSVGAVGAERSITNVAAGRVTNISTDVVNGSQLFATNQAINTLATNVTADATHYISVNDGGTQDGNYHNDGATGANSLAVGVNAAASALQATAIGSGAKASNAYTIALGTDAVASGGYSQAFGQEATASGSAAIAFGISSIATEDDAVAFGHLASATAMNATAIGSYAEASAAYATAFGNTAAASGEQSLAVGFYSIAEGENATALGTNAWASSDRSTALGYDSHAAGVESLAVGILAEAHGSNSIAMGLNAVAGIEDSTTVTGDVAIGTGASATGGDSIAHGTDAVADSADAVAIGHGAKATGGKAVSIGSGNSATGDGAVAIGDPNSATGTGAVAMGANNSANGQGAISLGNLNSATGKGSLALGNSSTAAAAGAIALGDTAVASNAGDVALGSGSVTAAPHVGAFVLPGSATAAAGIGPTNVVSVGAAGAERQIQNVGAGVLSVTSTDAVNGSQLFATNQLVGQNTSAITNLTDVSNSNTTNVAQLQQGALQWSGTLGAYDASHGSGMAQKITNIATGVVSAASTDAINGSQLFATNQLVGQNASAITNLTDVSNGNTTNVAQLQQDALQWSGTLGAYDASHGSGTAQKITNIATGVVSAASSDAVNGSQLFATNQAILTATDLAGAGWNLTAQGGNQTNVAPGGVVDFRSSDSNVVVTKGAANNTVGFALADDITIHSVTLGNSVLDTAGLYFTGGGPSITATGINAGGLVISGVAPGIAGTDAVNIDQLTALGTATASALGGTSIYSSASRTFITGLDVGGNAYTSVQDALNAVNGSATSGWNIGANGGAASNVIPGGTVQFYNGRNVEVTRSGTGLTIGTSANLQADSVALASGQLFDVFGLNMDATKITGLADGAVTAVSTDAVSGSQLFATNQQIGHLGDRVTQNETDIVSLGDTINAISGDTSTFYTASYGSGIRYARTNETGLTESDAFAKGAGSSAIGYEAVAIGAGALALGKDAQAETDGSVAIGAGSIADRAVTPTNGSIISGLGTITYNTTDKELLGAVSVGTDTAYRQIINVADGTKAQDAVTIRQLQGAIGALSSSSTMYFHANPGDPADPALDSLAIGAFSVAAGPNTVVNGDNGIGIGNGAVVDMMAPGGTAIGENAYVALADGVAIGTKSKAQGEQALALGAGAEAGQALSVAIGAQSVTTIGAQTGYAAYALATPQNSFGEVSVGAAGKARKLTNVAAGSVDTDAVNVSQLRAVNGNIVGVLGGAAMVNPDGSISGPSYEIQGNSYSTVYESFAAVNQNLTSIGSVIDTLNGGAGIKYFHANSSLADSQATGAHSVAIGPQSVATGDDSFAAGNGAMAASQGAVALGAGAQANNDNDVALGSGSTTQAAIGTSGVTIKGQHYDFAGTSPTGTVSVGSEGAERTITNVAAGRLSSGSTDAVNGSQLYATNQAVDTLQGSVVSLNEDTVQYDRDSSGAKTNRITLQGGDPNAPVLLSNVGPGLLDTDAANVAQVNNAVVQSKSYTDQQIDTVVETAHSYTDQVAVSTLGQANTYTDQKFSVLNQQIGAVRSEARQAAAIGLAAASLRYDDNPGKLSVSIGGGSWRGEGAFAMGAGFTSDNGRVRADLSSSAAGGHWGVGGGLSFTLN